MAYTKQTWVTGDIISAEKLNHMEDGIAGALTALRLTETVSGTTHTLDYTWKQIHDFMSAGGIVYMTYEGEYEDGGITDYYVFYSTNISCSDSVSSNVHTYHVLDGSYGSDWYCDTETGYPSFTE